MGDSFNRYALDRASFEMNCPKEKMQVQSLNVPLDSNAAIGSQVGVQGCDKRAVYVLAQGAGWLLNNQQQMEEAPAPQPAPAVTSDTQL
ncbi:hypothetical protein ACLESD_40800 [Pyxidicoccus sp. 3LFB2]